MSSICQNTEICKDGNCLGCKNGKLNCHDICFPNCEGCFIPSDYETVSFVIVMLIFLCLSVILISFYIIFGFNHY
jgi:hypothetical protein